MRHNHARVLLMALFLVPASSALASTIWYVNGVNGSDGNNCLSPTTACNPGNITVIDGRTNSTTTIRDPNAISPVALAVNEFTDKVYVSNIGDFPGPNHGNVTVIDGRTNATKTVTDPNALAPLRVAVDAVTNRIYVTNANSFTLSGNGGVTVINGRTNSTTTVIDPNAKTDLPGSLAVNPFTDNVYVANVISDNVTVIHGPK